MKSNTNERFNNELYHWLYTRRWRDKNGNWRYEYDSKSKHGNAVKEFIDTKITGKAYKQSAYEDRQKENAALQKVIRYERHASGEASASRSNARTAQEIGRTNQTELTNYTVPQAIRYYNNFAAIQERSAKEIKKEADFNRMVANSWEINYSRAMHKYKTQSLAGISKELINNGKNFVYTLFGGFNKKKNLSMRTVRYVNIWGKARRSNYGRIDDDY